MAKLHPLNTPHMSKRIISASYKDDTPAFKSEAFFRDYAQGFRILSTKVGPQRVSLLPQDVHCFVFWTKNPSPHFVENVGTLKSPWYLQWTISGYGRDIETNLPNKQAVVEAFQAFSMRFGRERAVWRYDPILISDRYTVEAHKAAFDALAEQLAPYTDTCVISFLDEYSKIQQEVRTGAMRSPTTAEILALSEHIGATATRLGLRVQTCAEGKYDLRRFGIAEGPCIDPDKIEALTGEKLPDAVRNPGSFRRCLCAVNTDIGAYHTCRHGCKYCYAK